jgi:hypothetical protein
VKPYLDHVGKYKVHRDLKPHGFDGVVLTAPRTGVLHTTEGGWDGSESVFKRHYAPHFMLGMLHGQPYIEQYGVYGMARATDPHRNQGQYGTVAGWYGHGDVPENFHWDPGNLRWSEIFQRAEALKTVGIA